MNSFRWFEQRPSGAGVSPLVRALVVMQAAAIVAFLELGRRADAAMDKSGVGDYTAFSTWNDRAAVAFWIFAVLWLATASLLVNRYRAELLRMGLASAPAVALWLVPAAGAAAWIAALVWM